MSEGDPARLVSPGFDELLDQLRAAHVETSQKDFSDHLQRGNQSLLHKLRELESRNTEKIASLNDHISTQKYEIDELRAKLRNPHKDQASEGISVGASGAAGGIDDELKSRLKELESELAIWEKLLRLPLDGRIRLLQVVDGIISDGKLVLPSQTSPSQGAQRSSSSDCQSCETQKLVNAIALKDLNLKWQTRYNGERKIREKLEQSLEDTYKQNDELRIRFAELRDGDSESVQRYLSPPPRSHDSLDLSNTGSEDWKTAFEELKTKYNRLVNNVRKNTAKWEDWKRRTDARSPPKLEIMNHIAVTDLVKFSTDQDAVVQSNIGDVDVPNPNSAPATSPANVPSSQGGRSPRRSASLASLKDRVTNSTRSPSFRLSLTGRAAAAAAATAAAAASPPSRQLGQFPRPSASNPPLKVLKHRAPYDKANTSSSPVESRRGRLRDDNSDVEKLHDDSTDNGEPEIASLAQRRYTEVTDKDTNQNVKGRDSPSGAEGEPFAAPDEASQTFPNRATETWKSPQLANRKLRPPTDSQETIAPPSFGSFSPRNSNSVRHEATGVPLGPFVRDYYGWENDDDDDDLDATDKKRKSVGEEDDILATFAAPRKKVRTPPMSGILGQDRTSDGSTSPSHRIAPQPANSTSSTSRSSDAPRVSLSTPAVLANNPRERRTTLPAADDSRTTRSSPRVAPKESSVIVISGSSSPPSPSHSDDLLSPAKRKPRPVSDTGSTPGRPEVRARVYSESRILETPGFGRSRVPQTPRNASRIPEATGAYTPAPSTSSASSKRGSVAQGSDLEREAWEETEEGEEDEEALDKGKENARRGANTAAKKKGGITYKYDETVRGKDARKMMHGVDCPCCERFYKATGPVPIPESARPPPFRTPSPEPTSNEDQLIQQHIQEVSRHRHINKPPGTPPGFWKVDFPSTQEVEEWNVEAKDIERAKQVEREKELRKTEREKRRTRRGAK